MFYHVRYQTGEIEDVVKEMKKGIIPCMDVDDMNEFNWVVNKLSEYGVHLVESLPFDKDARDRVKEPEFEFRAPFSVKDSETLMYIDFYFEPFIEEDYDPIFGD
ncbi:MAG: hypothetical protein ACOYWZ_18015 [Bacillota bacterium]